MNTIQKFAPNQLFWQNETEIIFQSYQTIVCVIENYDTTCIVKITEGQPQSRTTAKYLNKFLQKFTKFSTHKDIK